MKKINVLKNSRDFKRIMNKEKSYKTKYYFIYKENTNDTYHFGISVSKKIGNAVIRNKYKRQIRSIIDKKLYKNNFNCIIILRKSALDASYSLLKEDLLKGFEQLKIEGENKNEK